MNGRDRGQALASALAEQDRQAQLARRRHAGTLADAHARGWCHDSRECPACARERAHADAHVRAARARA